MNVANSENFTTLFRHVIKLICPLESFYLHDWGNIVSKILYVATGHQPVLINSLA